MTSIVYTSTALHPFSDEDLGQLLVTSRANNARTGLTGMLLYRSGRFLQVLEGPEDSLKERMAIIGADSRHAGVRVLLREPIAERQFPDWTMGHEPFSASLAKDIPGYRSTFEDEDPADTIQALRELIRWFQERAIPLR
jgi:hypothetical protein